MMRTEIQLLESMKRNKAERLRLLTLQNSSQLVKLIEEIGFFESIDSDIRWLEAKINSKAGA